MPEAFKLPKGFTYQEGTTGTAGIEYAYKCPIAKDLNAWRSLYEANKLDADATILAVLNGNQSQNARQNPKESIRKAIAADDSSEASVAAAVEAAQEVTATFISGAPRQRIGGVTKTAARNKGELMQQKQQEYADAGKTMPAEEMLAFWNSLDEL